MSRDYTIEPVHHIGKKVYMVDKDMYGEKKPKVLVGTVTRITAILDEDTISRKGESTEPILQYNVKIADSYKEPDNYFDFQLLSKSEAERRYNALCKDLKTFDDIYLKTMLEKAHKLIEAYEK